MVLREYNSSGKCVYICGNNNENVRQLLQAIYNADILKSKGYLYKLIEIQTKTIEFGLSNGRVLKFTNVPFKDGGVNFIDLPDFDENVDI